MDKFINFMSLIFPSLTRFGVALFKLHDGDITLASRDIESRIDEVKERRAAVDAALEAKHRDNTPTE